MSLRNINVIQTPELPLKEAKANKVVFLVDFNTQNIW